ncbi:S8 family peptidase [Streptomyces sp. NBC_01310]|uniref:S8 family peptidase n=1 Tax=Streptomyces sp. NBC_01310 TaxID=2903820 RepID=UPI0035B59B61|nr:S8 family peptidase [Streptomyces sp. NBC_01310]
MRFEFTRPAFSTVVGISLLLVAGTPSTSLALAGPAGTASPSASTSSLPGKGAPADAQQWIPLITGDRVAVNAKGEVVARYPAKGREDIPLFTETVGRHTYAVPADARALINSGRLDRRLFDVTTLSSSFYAKHQDVRLIVRYEGARPAARTALHATAGAEVQRTLPSINADAVTAPVSSAAKLWSTLTSGTADATNRTAAPGIASVWLDGVVGATLDKSVPQIGAPAAWDAGFDGAGVRIAVLDSGVDSTHPDLAGQVVAERNFSASPNMKDLYGHGTHVASIAAGTGAKSGGTHKGVAPGARILNAKVLDDRGQGSMSGVIAGMEWAAAEKVDIANLSLGSQDAPGTDPMEAAVERLTAESGTLFVIAAGNSGGAGTVATPGSADAALTVGAVDKQDQLASFSSAGPRVGDSAIKPDLTAPGVDIAAAIPEDSLLANIGAPPVNGYKGLNGTSMATPHVAGAAAILAQQHPDWTADDIKKALVGSTKPGAHTAFEQGSGRVDLDRALKQSVVGRETSLSFGLAQWPHTDDQPVAKNLTYRNTGSAPVTLKLTVNATGPDGNPAPQDMFTVDEQVTIAAHGEATVKVTADTRPGGDLHGTYSGRITATGGGQSVGTAVGVERESERYTVTFKPLDRTGKPMPAPAWTATLQGLAGPAETTFAPLNEGQYSIRVPKGRYLVNSILKVDPAGSYAQGMDWINQPRLDITADTTITLDARTTKPIDVTVPNKHAQQAMGHIALYTAQASGTGIGYGLITKSFERFRTAHLGPKVDLGEQPLSEALAVTFTTGATGHDDYHLTYTPKGDTLLTGFTHHPKSRDFAKVEQRLGATAKNQLGFVTMRSEQGGGFGTPRALPYTGTVHLLSSSPTWWSKFTQVDMNDVEQSSHYANGQQFKPNRSYEQTFNVGVFGPDLPPGAGLIRADETMTGDLPLFSDGNDNFNLNGMPHTEALTEIHRNGERVKWSINPMDVFYIAEPERADYRLTAVIDRSTLAPRVSTRVTSSWTFSSEYAPGVTALPVSVVRFTPALSLDNTAKAGARMRIPVAVKGSAAGNNLKSLSVYASYDEGAHWHKLTVRDGRVEVTNPKAGGSVSLKAEAVDKQGNAVEQTISNAYLTE